VRSYDPDRKIHAPARFEGTEVDGQAEVFLVLEVDESAYCANLRTASGSARNVLDRVPVSRIRVLDPGGSWVAGSVNPDCGAVREPCIRSRIEGT
jgi:hypothetical protein